MKYGDYYKIIDINEDVIKKIDNKISNMNLQIKDSLVNKGKLSRLDPNHRISKQAWIKEKSLLKFFLILVKKLMDFVIGTLILKVLNQSNLEYIVTEGNMVGM